MKKTLKILLDNGDYKITSSDEKVLIINGQTLLMKAKDVYEKFFYDVLIGQKCEFDIIIDSSCVGGREQHIANEIKTILENIIEKINDQVKEENPQDNH